MTDAAFLLVTLLALFIAAATLISRHRLRIRHEAAKAAKAALRRVAQERDQLRWDSLGKPVE